MEPQKTTRSASAEADCEHCLYFDYDEELEEEVCTMHLDEDEYAAMMQNRKKRCPYFRFYDEYKSVQKQI